MSEYTQTEEATECAPAAATETSATRTTAASSYSEGVAQTQVHGQSEGHHVNSAVNATSSNGGQLGISSQQTSDAAGGAYHRVGVSLSANNGMGASSSTGTRADSTTTSGNVNLMDGVNAGVSQSRRLSDPMVGGLTTSTSVSGGRSGDGVYNARLGMSSTETVMGEEA